MTILITYSLNYAKTKLIFLLKIITYLIKITYLTLATGRLFRKIMKFARISIPMKSNYFKTAAKTI